MDLLLDVVAVLLLIGFCCYAVYSIARYERAEQEAKELYEELLAAAGILLNCRDRYRHGGHTEEVLEEIVDKLTNSRPRFAVLRKAWDDNQPIMLTEWTRPRLRWFGQRPSRPDSAR